MAESSSNSPSSTPGPIAEIDLGPSRLDQFLDNHQTKLIILAILIALGVVAYVIQQGLAEAEAQEAGSALLTAQNPDQYQAVINTWPESNAAASARLLLADLQWSDAQPDSIATLEEFISNDPEHPSLPTAKVSLGLRLLEQGKTAEASDILSEVADGESYIAPLACIALGDIAKAAGKGPEATQWYEKGQQNSSGQGNAFQGLAASRLLIVNAKPPTKITPALPAPAASDPSKTKVSPLQLIKPDTPDSTTEAQSSPPAPQPADVKPADVKPADAQSAVPKTAPKTDPKTDPKPAAPQKAN